MPADCSKTFEAPIKALGDPVKPAHVIVEGGRVIGEARPIGVLPYRHGGKIAPIHATSTAELAFLDQASHRPRPGGDRARPTLLTAGLDRAAVQ